MKTIAISIDEASLAAINRLVGFSPRRASSGRPRRTGAHGSRSQVIRLAVQEFLARHERVEREAAERRVLARHRAKLARQAEALVAEQAAL